MDQTVISLEAVKADLEKLAKSHSVIVVRATALQAMVGVLAWGVGKTREEIAERVLATGVASLAGLQGLPPHLEEEVSSLFNTVYAQLLNKDIAPEAITRNG